MFSVQVAFGSPMVVNDLHSLRAIVLPREDDEWIGKPGRRGPTSTLAAFRVALRIPLNRAGSLVLDRPVRLEDRGRLPVPCERS